MARVSSLFHSLLLVSSLLLASQTLVSSRTLGKKPPLVPGLSWNYYFPLECPNLERIIRNSLQKSFKKDSGLAPGILRLFFHDCFANVRLQTNHNFHLYFFFHKVSTNFINKSFMTNLNL